jgi:hypothetical protein
MSKSNLIIWQKWADPFGQEDIENEEHDPYVGEYSDEESDVDSSDDQPISPNAKQAVRVIATPMGIIPMNDNTMSGKLFNFWIGHTNFNLSKKIVDIIETTEGIETLDIFTRYRFRISVGKAFDDSEVMRDVNKKVYRELNNG